MYGCASLYWTFTEVVHIVARLSRHGGPKKPDALTERLQQRLCLGVPGIAPHRNGRPGGDGEPGARASRDR